MLEEAFHSDDVLHVRRNPWMLGLAAAPAVLGVVAFAVVGWRAPELVLGINLFALGILALNYVWRKNPWSLSVRARTHADKERVTIGPLTVQRSAVKDAFLLPRAGKRPLVRIARKSLVAPPIELELASEGEARRLLRALGLDASQTVSSFRLPSRLLAHRATMIGMMLGLMGAVLALSSHRVLGVQAIAPLLVLVSLFFVVPSTLSVGVDGILVSWFGRKRFVRHADIDMLSTYEDGFGKSRYVGIELLLTSGEVIKIPINQSGWEDGQVEIIEARIRAARGAAQHDPRMKDTAFLLGRQGRSVDDWMTSLRAIGSGSNATHRIAPIDHETLWQLLEDPSADASVRAAAAVALRTELDA
ncbi:MAG: hypothetical protein ABIP39_09580, partial [Polyangiaceae bacterium]